MQPNRRAVLRAALCSTALAALSGCGIYAGFSSDPMGMLLVSYDGGDHPSPEQFEIIQELAKKKNIVISWQQSSAAESIIIGGLAYGPTYALAGALEGAYYPPPAGEAAAVVNGVSGLAGGAANGAQVWSYNRVNALSSFVNHALDNWAKGVAIDPDMLKRHPKLVELCQGLTTAAGYVRTENGTDQPAPNLVPDFHGAKVGTPARRGDTITPRTLTPR